MLHLSFSTPFHAHAFMETQAAIADVRADGADLWLGSQDTFFHQAAIAKITGLDQAQINVHPMLLGGGFGGKVFVQAAMEATILSQAVKKPVKVVWSREESFQYGYFRTPSKHIIEAGVTQEGMISHWHHQFGSGRVIFTNSADSQLFIWVTSFFKDPGAIRGAIPPYSFPNRKVEYWNQTLPVPTGATRGLSAPINAFAIEVTIDALAHLAQKDPLAFRLQHLNSKQKRLKRVLEAVAKKSNWAKPLPSNQGRGIACGIYKNSTYVAVVAEVQVWPETHEIKVLRLICAQDCGLIINPDSVKAQIEGNLIWGCSMALKESFHVKDGQMSANNFDKYALLRHHEAPEIETVLIENKKDPPVGSGEPAIMPTPAAIVNAIYHVVGIRVTELPIVL